MISMNEIIFDLKPFSVPSIEEYRELICHPAVTRHMPLAQAEYSNEWIQEWIARKESTWPDKEYGPWSVWHNSTFVGWAGLEPEGEDLSVGIVLHKEYWGSGKVILKQVFTKMGRKIKGKRVTVEFPKSRHSAVWASRLGLVEIEEIEVSGIVFVRYELSLPL
ncbi:MAG: GNAT family N-acetyltransferase [Actinomycetales bacterium]|nr:GNAT family N-acetyltransferase [Actinomycetales bacterium]